jgi:hypothetical protein
MALFGSWKISMQLKSDLFLLFQEEIEPLTTKFGHTVNHVGKDTLETFFKEVFPILQLHSASVLPMTVSIRFNSTIFRRSHTCVETFNGFMNKQGQDVVSMYWMLICQNESSLHDLEDQFNDDLHFLLESHSSSKRRLVWRLVSLLTN